MDNRRVQELLEEEDRDDDSIPLADDDPADVLEESNMTEDKRKVKSNKIICDDRKLQAGWCGWHL